jgi:hypothetical protein
MANDYLHHMAKSTVAVLEEHTEPEFDLEQMHMIMAGLVGRATWASKLAPVLEKKNKTDLSDHLSVQIAESSLLETEIRRATTAAYRHSTPNQERAIVLERRKSCQPENENVESSSASPAPTESP